MFNLANSSPILSIVLHLGLNDVDNVLVELEQVRSVLGPWIQEKEPD